MTEKNIRIKLNEIELELKQTGRSAGLLNEAGVGYFLLGEFESALSRFQSAVDIKKKPDILFNLANTYSEIDQPDMAISTFLEVLELDPSHIGSLNNLADEYEKKGDVDKAHELFHYITHLNPEKAIAHFNLGNFFLRQNQHIEATKCYETAILKDPDFTDAYYNIGWILFRVKAYEKSIIYINKGLKIEPNHEDLISLKNKVSKAYEETAG